MNIYAAIRVMRERGLSADDILAVVETLVDDDKERSPAAERQARYRERQKERPVDSSVTRDATRDVTNVTPLPPLSSPPSFSPEPPKPTPPIIPPIQSSSAVADVQALERECRKIAGSEPVALAQDFDALAAVLSEGVTAADVIAGVRAAMETQGFRPRSWRPLTNWARRAAKDRLGLVPKVVPMSPARAPPERFGVAEAMVEMMRTR